MWTDRLLFILSKTILTHFKPKTKFRLGVVLFDDDSSSRVVAAATLYHIQPKEQQETIRKSPGAIRYISSFKNRYYPTVETRFIGRCCRGRFYMLVIASETSLQH
jgi:hypothetical protein